MLFGALRDRRMLASVWFVALPALSSARSACSGRCGSHDLGFGAVAIGGVWLVAARFEATARAARRRVSDRRGALVPLAARRSSARRSASRSSRARRRWGTFAAVIVVLQLRARRVLGARDVARSDERATRSGSTTRSAFALINLAWAPAQVVGRRGRRRSRTRRRDAVLYLAARRAVRAYACRAVEIRKLLVANRGEIALRVFRTCRALGIATVAVAAPDDRGSLHARSADETVEIAGYLHSEEHIRAAKRRAPTRSIPATASSPRARTSPRPSEAAGLVWVGPPPEALRAGGDKLEAKRIAAEAGVPVVERASRRSSASRSLVKAAAGGGGRGMRVVRSRGRARRRARGRAARGEGGVRRRPRLRERYVERPRHVEIQLLADAHGKVVALGERECSIQRRHQKVLEESPSPALDPDAARAR